MYTLIMNPTSGHGAAVNKLPAIEAMLTERSLEYQVKCAQTPEEATILARQAAQEAVEGVIAVGGDGTLFQIANGLAGSDVPMLFVSCGTGNDFVKALTPYTKQDFLQIENYLEPSFEHCDVLKVEDEYSLNTVSIGFDVKVAAGVDAFRKLPFSNNTIPYVLSFVLTILKKSRM